MSFFGKKWQKDSYENVVELMDALNLDDNVRSLLNKPEAIASFSQNEDGSIQHTAELDGETIFDQTLVLDEESEFTIPGGLTATQMNTLDGDTLKTVYTDGDRSLTFLREFGDDTLTLTISGDFVDVTATIGYKEVE